MSVPYLHEHDVNQSDSPLLTSSVPSPVEVRRLTRLGKFARRRTCHLAPSPRACVGEEATASASGQTNAQTENAMTGAFVYVPHSTSHRQIQKKGKARTHSTTQTKQNTKQNKTK